MNGPEQKTVRRTFEQEFAWYFHELCAQSLREDQAHLLVDAYAD